MSKIGVTTPKEFLEWKFWGNTIILTIVITVFSLLYGAFWEIFSSIFGTFTLPMAGLFAAVLLVYGMYLHPGKEDFLSSLVTILLVVSLSEILVLLFGATMPIFAFDWSLGGVALGLALVYFAATLVSKYSPIK